MRSPTNMGLRDSPTSGNRSLESSSPEGSEAQKSTCSPRNVSLRSRPCKNNCTSRGREPETPEFRFRTPPLQPPIGENSPPPQARQREIAPARQRSERSERAARNGPAAPTPARTRSTDRQRGLVPDPEGRAQPPNGVRGIPTDRSGVGAGSRWLE